MVPLWMEILCAVAMAALDVVIDEKLSERAENLKEIFQKRNPKNH